MINIYSTKSIYYHLGDFYMALRLRRGSDTDRQTETFAEGELIYITDTKELYVGDGTTLGGVLVTSSSGVSPAQLTQNLDLNSFSINGIGIITATAFFGDGSGLTGISGGGGTGIIEGQEYLIDIIGDVRGSDSTLLVDSTTNTFAGDLVGSVFGDNSILLVDAVNNVIPYAVLDGAPTALSDFSNDLDYAAIVGTAIQLNGLPVDTFMTGNLDAQGNDVIDANLVNATGNLTGDVIALDTAVLVNATTGKITGNIENIATQTEQFKLYAAIGEVALSEFKKTDTGITFNTNTIISQSQSVYTDFVGSGTAWTSTHYKDRTVSYVSDAVSANAISHSITGVHIGSETTASEKLEVTGNTKLNLGSLILNDTRAYTDIVSPQAGEIMFDKLQEALYIYNNTEWVKLVGEGQSSGALELSSGVLLGQFSQVDIDNVGGDSTTITGALLYNTDQDRVQFFQAGSWVNLPNNGAAIGEVLKWNGTEWAAALDTGGVAPGSNADFLDGFDGTYYLDYTNFANTPTTLAGYGITDAATSAQGNLADSAVQPADLGNFTFTSGTLDTNDSVGITITPAVTINSNLLVENDLRVSNVVYADKFVSTDASTPSIEAATNLDLTAGNAVRITSSVLRLASFTTTERDALAAQNGDVIYNTTDNKFQGYENGAWANLI